MKNMQEKLKELQTQFEIDDQICEKVDYHLPKANKKVIAKLQKIGLIDNDKKIIVASIENIKLILNILL